MQNKAELVPEANNPIALDRYAYTANNPLKYVDTSGHCWGPASFIRGLPTYGTTCNNLDMALTIAAHPEASSGQKAGAVAYIATEGTAHLALAVGGSVLAWEGGAAVVGALGGAEAAGTAGTVGTAACADGDCTNEATMGLNVFTRAAEFGIQSYSNLRNAIRGTGLQAHHVIEQRFASRLGLDTELMQSVALTPEEHQMFTNAWRSQIQYGMDYTLLTVDDIWFAAQQVYVDYPELLEAARQTLFGP